jgi:hypothetical protein
LYKWSFKPANLSSFQAASIVIPVAITTLVMVVAAYAFPARGAAAERSSAFFDRLARPAISTSPSEASPGPVAGLVIGSMGLVLLVIGSGMVTPHANTLTLGTGGALVAIGVMLYGGRWIRRSGDREAG